jgi:hypothetical protein
LVLNGIAANAGVCRKRKEKREKRKEKVEENKRAGCWALEWKTPPFFLSPVFPFLLNHVRLATSISDGASDRDKKVEMLEQSGSQRYKSRQQRAV